MVLVGQSISILGAGIGGLTAAVALALRGAQVTVIERAPEISEVGAGLQISPNGMRVLDRLGLGDALRACAPRSEAVVLRDASDGQDVLRMPLPETPGFYLAHRADLITLLAEAAVAAGVTLQLGTTVTGVDLGADGRACLRIDDRPDMPCDLLVGADGLKSQVRKVVDRPSNPYFTGQVAWRMIVRSQTPVAPEAHVYMGPGRHLVTYPLRDGFARNIVAVEERDSWIAEGWNQRDDHTRVARAFSSFPPEVRGWLEAARDVHIWGLFRHDVAQNWHKGRAVILGDAAHPTLPFLAQGANMAIEDAWVLADCLSAEETAEAAFARFQAVRRPRVSRAVDTANANARAYHLHPGPVRAMAHAGLKLASRVSPSMPLRRFDWLYRTDVTSG